MYISRTPLYHQIEEYLLRLIGTNFFNNSADFPSEAAVSLQFGVSRVTSRRAILSLTERGFLLRKKGSGTKINKNLNEEQLSVLKKYADTTPPPTNIGKTRKTVAVILPDLKSKYMIEILDGIQKVATQNEWDVLVAISNYDQELETALICKFLSYCNGLIIFPVTKTTYNKEILKLSLKNYPLVVIDNLLHGVEVSSISSDNKNTAFKVTKAFIRQGKTNIGIISQPFESAFSLQERYRGYRDALGESDIPINKNLILNSLEHYDENAEKIILGFFNKNPQLDALISFNYEIGIKTAKVLKSGINRLSVGDLMIFDEEFENLYDLLEYKLNYIKQNALAIGKNAFSIVLEKTKNPDYLNRHIVIPETIYFSQTK